MAVSNQQELAAYRKQTTVSSADECDVHGVLTEAEKDSVPHNAETKIEKLKDVIPVLIEQYTAMADIMDNVYARAQGEHEVADYHPDKLAHANLFQPTRTTTIATTFSSLDWRRYPTAPTSPAPTARLFPTPIASLETESRVFPGLSGKTRRFLWERWWSD